VLDQALFDQALFGQALFDRVLFGCAPRVTRPGGGPCRRAPLG
jgi:hypothetical protein